MPLHMGGVLSGFCLSLILITYRKAPLHGWSEVLATFNMSRHHISYTSTVFISDHIIQEMRFFHLPMQETRVLALVWEDRTCRGATKSVHHKYCSPHALEPVSHNY